MFQKHEESILIITTNTKIVNDRTDKLSNKVDESQESIEFTENEVNDKIKDKK